MQSRCTLSTLTTKRLCWCHFCRPHAFVFTLIKYMIFLWQRLSLSCLCIYVCKCRPPLEVSVINGTEVIWKVNRTYLEQRIDIGLSRILSYALDRRWKFVSMFEKYTKRKKRRDCAELCGVPYLVAEKRNSPSNIFSVSKEFIIEGFVYGKFVSSVLVDSSNIWERR